jgi:hypothetical protein
MSEQKQGSSTKVNTRIRDTLLVVLAALFSFGGPYVVYALTHFGNLSYGVSIGPGLLVFAIGLALTLYLIRKKVV